MIAEPIETHVAVDRVAQLHAQIDELEKALVDFPKKETRLIHTFTPGLYSRTIVMAPGCIYTSKIHKTEHQFVVLRGLCSVKNVLTGEWEHVQAPYLGITKPGSRRVLVIHEETTWTTFHPTSETDLERIEEQLIERHDQHLALDKRSQSCLGD